MRIVCITGTDGAGKSTQIAELGSALGERGLTVRAVSIWDGLTSEAVRDRLAFQSREQVYRYLEVLTPLSRTYFLFHALRLSLDLAADGQSDILLLDGYWYKYYATEVAGGVDAEAVRAMAAGFPVPDRTFYLKVDTRDAALRKQELTAYERGFSEADRFTSLQTESQRALESLAAELDWRVVDGKGEVAQITAELLAELLREDGVHDR